MVSWIAAIVLAAVFGWSATAKCRDVPATHEAAAALLNRKVAAAIAPGLIIAEFTIATLLLLPTTRTYGSIAAMGLLLIFSALIASRLRAGQAPACFCFGTRSAAPISSLDLARNGALGVLAVVAAIA
jgi:hypothetical protein